REVARPRLREAALQHRADDRAPVAHDQDELRVREHDGEVLGDQEVLRRGVDPAPADRAAQEEVPEAVPDARRELLERDPVPPQPSVLAGPPLVVRLADPALPAPSGADQRLEEVRLRGRPVRRVLCERPRERARPRARAPDDEDALRRALLPEARLDVLELLLELRELAMDVGHAVEVDSRGGNIAHVSPPTYRDLLAEAREVL